MTIASFTSLLIGIAGFCVAFATLWINRNKTIKEEAKETVEEHADLRAQVSVNNAKIFTRLDTIDDGVRDIKADNRGIRSDIASLRDTLRDEIRDVHDEAKHALELAEAAHRRLDRAGIDQDVSPH